MEVATVTERPIRVDVAIVGAGPAGSTLAALLARRGVSVALIERDTFPRDKVCGEFLSYDAVPIVERLGVDLSGSPAITLCRIVGRRRSYAFDLPMPARGASRLHLDKALFDAAVREGARGLEGHAATGIGADGVIAGETSVEAAVVAGAWGRWGRFDQQFARSFVRDRSRRNFGFKRHYTRTTAAAAARESTELYTFENGYLGVNDVEGGITNVCGLVHASRLEGHRGRWESFVESLRSEEPHIGTLYESIEPAQDGFLTSEPVIFRARSAVEQGVFMIGDASGVIDPLTGNGMAMALQSALLAAPLLLRLLARPDDRPVIEAEYRRLHRATFSRRIRWSRVVARLLSRPALLDAALAGVRTTPSIGRMLARNTRGDREALARRMDEWMGE